MKKLTDQQRGPETRLTAVDGPPGSGKTRKVLELAAAHAGRGAIVTYTRAAAEVLRGRLPLLSRIEVGTIYALSWGVVKRFTTGKAKGLPKARAPWLNRPIEDRWDPALDLYERTAPSRIPTRYEDDIAVELHAWDGRGDPPCDLNAIEPRGALRYILPLARWVAAGCPIDADETYPFLAIDEAQDMGRLELAATLGLARGNVIAFGDPGQAIFAESKGGGTPSWTLAGEHYRLEKGYRCGERIARLATKVLKPVFYRPAASFATEDLANVQEWHQTDNPPHRGLVLGLTRTSVADYYRYHRLRETNIVPQLGLADERLVCSTIHSAKGAEADNVYLLEWGQQNTLRLEQRNPELLKTLYVAMTRARKNLYLSWSTLLRTELI